MVAITEYAARRQQLLHRLDAGACVLLPASVPALRNNDTEYPYRPDSNFYYLTGFSEANALLVLAPGSSHGETIFFNQASDPAAEQWTGPRAGQQGACAHFGADAAFDITQVDEILPTILADYHTIYYPVAKQREFDKKVMHWLAQLQGRVRQGKNAPTQFADVTAVIADMRLRKSAAEIALIRKAVDVTVIAHHRAMQRCRPGCYEYQLAGELQHAFYEAGCQYVAYPSIVGSGANACVLHYIANDKVCQDGELVLIDAGAEHALYAADLTRTFPVSGQFSGPQRAIYDLVLAAQKAALDVAKPGVAWHAMQDEIVSVLTDGLLDLKILSGSRDEILENKSYRQFYMHNSGHWMGLDVHDVGTYRTGDSWRKLEANMVLTIEPGLYLSPSDDLDEKWWNIGVRIEDDVLITPQGNEVLSAELVKEADDIMQVMQS